MFSRFMGKLEILNVVFDQSDWSHLALVTKYSDWKMTVFPLLSMDTPPRDKAKWPPIASWRDSFSTALGMSR